MDEKIVNWAIDLQGGPHDLEYCATYFSNGTEIRVEREQSGNSIPRYYLESSEFEGLPDTRIHIVAAELIAKLNAEVKLRTGGGSVMMGIPVTIRADGSRIPMKVVTAGFSGPLEISSNISSDQAITTEWQTRLQIDTNLPFESLAESIVMADFAEDWFNDARCEATKETAAARRREIIFAVCTAESYLLEWTREILLQNYPKAELLDRLNRYFPEDEKNPIIYKWKVVPKKLYRHKLIKGKPGLTGQTWQTWKAFKKKVYKYYRNSLLHATVSRPQKKVTAFVTPPPNWKAELQNLEPGWAIKIVAKLIRDLNDQAGTCAPGWLDQIYNFCAAL